MLSTLLFHQILTYFSKICQANRTKTLQIFQFVFINCQLFTFSNSQLHHTIWFIEVEWEYEEPNSIWKSKTNKNKCQQMRSELFINVMDSIPKLKNLVANDTWTSLGDESEVSKGHFLRQKPLQNDFSRAQMTHHNSRVANDTWTSL